jgi:hypothetical protein
MNNPAQVDERAAYTAKLAERGLAIHSFDGQTLILNYNPAADGSTERGCGLGEEQLAAYARGWIERLPGAAEMFPGLDRVVVDFAAL